MALTDAQQLMQCVNYCNRLESLGVHTSTDGGAANWSSSDSYNDSMIWARHYASRLIEGRAAIERQRKTKLLFSQN